MISKSCFQGIEIIEKVVDQNPENEKSTRYSFDQIVQVIQSPKYCETIQLSIEEDQNSIDEKQLILNNNPEYLQNPKENSNNQTENTQRLMSFIDVRTIHDFFFNFAFKNRRSQIEKVGLNN